MPAIEAKHVQSGNQPVQIAYIGNKEMKKDTQCRTGVTWYGQFDIQAVDPVPASRLLKFPSVWIRADDLEKYKESIETNLVGEASQDDTTASEDERNSTSAEAEKEDAAGEAVTDRLEAIQSVVLSMDQENPEHFTDKGKPKIEAVRARMPDCEISTAEVTEAWKQLDAGQ